MTRSLRAILLVAAGLGSMGAAEPRQSTGRWEVNFASAQCLASRDYGSEQSPLFLVLKAPPLGE